MDAQEAKDRFLKDWYEQMKAADPHHFAEHTEGHDFSIIVPEYTFEQFASSSMAGAAWKVAAAHSAQVEAERDAALADADFWERELNNFRRNAAYRAEELAKVKVEAAETELVKLRAALRLAVDRFNLAYVSQETISCDVWAMEARRALGETVPEEKP